MRILRTRKTVNPYSKYIQTHLRKCTLGALILSFLCFQGWYRSFCIASWCLIKMYMLTASLTSIFFSDSMRDRRNHSPEKPLGLLNLPSFHNFRNNLFLLYNFLTLTLTLTLNPNFIWTLLHVPNPNKRLDAILHHSKTISYLNQNILKISKFR